MQIIHQESVDLELVADLLACGGVHKSPILRDKSRFHVTNLIESAKSITQGDVSYREFQGPIPGIMSFGRIWETAVDHYLLDYSTKYGGVYSPDVEREQDDIIASLDGIMLLPSLGLDYHGWLVCETKLRFSVSDEIPMKHLQQVRAYCYLANTDLVCYVSGHIGARPPVVQAQLRVIRFTRQSINETWEMLVKTKDYLVVNGKVPWISRDESFPSQDMVSL